MIEVNVASYSNAKDLLNAKVFYRRKIKVSVHSKNAIYDYTAIMSRSAINQSLPRGVKYKDVVENTGGETEVHISYVDESGNKHQFSGLAVCHDSDNFSRELGRNIAIQRAITQLNDHLEGKKKFVLSWVNDKNTLIKKENDATK